METSRASGETVEKAKLMAARKDLEEMREEQVRVGLLLSPRLPVFP